MVYPSVTELPEGWEARPEERRCWDGKVETNWYIYIDGEKQPSYCYNTREVAEGQALHQAQMRAIHELIEEVIGQERHYGIRVWSEDEPGRSTPTWKITDPHRGHEGFAFAWYSHTPPPVSVYTREQYEAVCEALELEPASDDELGNYADSYAVYDSMTYTPQQVITGELRRRRLAGIDREEAVREAERLRELAEAGLTEVDSYTREQYERACQILQVPVLSDGGCLALVENDLASLSGGIMVVDPGLPNDKLSEKLAYMRVTAMERTARQSGRRCDECGGVILGSAMAASLGLACSVDCFDAMSDRPGRYAQRQGQQ